MEKWNDVTHIHFFKSFLKIQILPFNQKIFIYLKFGDGNGPNRCRVKK